MKLLPTDWRHSHSDGTESTSVEKAGIAGLDAGLFATNSSQYKNPYPEGSEEHTEYANMWDEGFNSG